MKYLLGKASSLFIVSGLIKIAGGIAVCLWPVIDFATLIYLFGVPALIQGSVHIITAAHFRNDYNHWWVLLFLGSVYMAAGVAVIGYPDVTSLFLMIVIAATWFIVGVTMMVLALRLMHNDLGLLLSGVLSIMAAGYLFTNLQTDVFSILWIVVIYAFLIGILTIFFGIRARAWQHVYFDDIME